MSRVVVIGSGIAGLTTAVRARVRHGHEVVVVTKGALGEGTTKYAQGGIAAVTSPQDSVASHISDTLLAGAGLGDDAAVHVLCSEAPERIRDLIALGVRFDTDESGRGFALALEAAHSHARVLRAGGDGTGAAIEAALCLRIGELEAAGHILVLENTALADLVVEAGRVVGVRLLTADESMETRDADAVVLATGGAGQLFSHTTNPSGATGDGLAAARRVGAETRDLEFYQFHPTSLTASDGFLVSEAVRGEGAVLVNEAGERFMLTEHPDAELAPRDIVARGIARAVARQNGRPVLLDARKLGTQFLAVRFPTIHAELRRRGIDWGREPVEVAPAAHYWMGGIVTDLHGRTSIRGLFAVGEVARTGVHGGNRLASNSLTEGAVFGVRTADAIGTPWVPPKGRKLSAQPTPRPTPQRGEVPSRAGHIDAPPPFTRERLRRLMWERAGLLRNDVSLANAQFTLRAWAHVVIEGGAVPATLTELENHNLIEIALALVDAARWRTTSTGAHFRSDDQSLAIQTEQTVKETEWC